MAQSKVIYELVQEGAKVPKQATKASAGLDAHASIKGRTIKLFNEDNNPITLKVQDGKIEVPGHWRALIPLGFKARIPEGFECQVRPRSGVALKSGVTVHNAPGTIDSDYAEEWGCILFNASNAPFLVSDGDRVCQLVFSKVVTFPLEAGEVTQTTDRKGGYGSTGK